MAESAESELSSLQRKLKNPAHPFQEYPLGPVLKFAQKPFLSSEEDFFIPLSPYHKLGKPPYPFQEYFFQPALEFAHHTFLCSYDGFFSSPHVTLKKPAEKYLLRPVLEFPQRELF